MKIYIYMLIAYESFGYIIFFSEIIWYVSIEINNLV